MDYIRAHSEYLRAMILDTIQPSKVNLAKLYRKFGMLDKAHAYIREVKEEWYYGQRYYDHALKVGYSYLEEDNFLDAYWQFFKGSRNYPDVAIKYLNKAYKRLSFAFSGRKGCLYAGRKKNKRRYQSAL